MANSSITSSVSHSLCKMSFQNTGLSVNLTGILILSLEYYWEMGYIVFLSFETDKTRNDKVVKGEGLVVKFKMAAFNDNHICLGCLRNFV